MSEALVERLNAAEIALRDDRPYAAVAIGEASDRIEADAATIASLRDANKALTAERDEARGLVTEANNSLYGSQGYFHSLNGGPYDKYHLASRIENLKSSCRTAERKVAELEAERDDLAQRAAVIDEALTNAVQLRTAAEADKARLSEALRKAGVSFETIRLTLIKNLEEPERSAFWEAVHARDATRAALSGTGSGWPVPDGWKLVPVEPDNAMIDAGAEDVPVYVKRSARRTIAIDTYRAMIAKAPLPSKDGGE